MSGLDRRRLLVGCVFLIVFALDFIRPTDIDVWWHLKTGELIAQTGTVPLADTFSYTALGRSWVAHEWLWELGVYLLTRLGGYRLAVAASSIVVVLTCALLYRLVRRAGTNEFVAMAITLWAIALTIPSTGVRPRELTLLFFTYYLARLVDYRAGRARQLWSLPPLMALWVNLHGLFIMGIGLIGLFAIGDFAEWLLGRGKPPWHLIIVGLATLFATVVNPQGPAMLLYPLGYFAQSDNPSFAHVTEFQSPDFHDPLYLGFAAGLLLCMALGVSRDRPSLRDSLPVVTFAALSLISVRNVPLFAIVASPILASRFVDEFQWARRLPPLQASVVAAAVNWLLLICVVGIGLLYATTPAGSRRLQLDVVPNQTDLPIGGVRLIESQNLPGPIFDYEPWGGYLIYHWYPNPDRRVFIDGRLDMYGSAITTGYGDVVAAAPDWRQVLDKYGVKTMLVEKDSALSTLLLADSGWDRIYRGDVEEVFVRRITR
jgi:hypothetical protein